MIEKKLRVYKQILDKIYLAKNIALISHKNPDLDTIWSALGFYEIVKTNFQNKNLELFCIDDIPEKYKFLQNIEKYKKDFNPKNFDLIVFFDSWGKNQTWFDLVYPELYDKKSYNTLNIDHHITNEIYWKQNIINTKYSSTTMIIFEIFYLMKKYFSPTSATALLAWIYTDTWAFKHPNTDKNTYYVASKLVKLWWDFETIVWKFFKTNKLSTIKLWWRIMSESFIDETWVLYAYVNKTMLDTYNSTYEDISWVIDHLNTAEWIKYTTLLTQKWEYIKWSLRTLRDDVDLTQIAKKYDWWWHKKASWFTTEWQLESFKTLNFKV